MRSTLFFLSLLLCVATDAQVQSYKLDFTLSKKQFADTIGIRYEREKVLVPVVLGGQRYSFLLDTGASQTAIFEDSNIRGCEEIGTIESFDATGRRSMVPEVKLPPMRLGGLTLTGCRATRLPRASWNRGIDGILGFDLVNKGLQMKIDVRKGILVLTDLKRHFRRAGSVKMKYRQNYHVPYIRIMPYRNYREWALFDTGSPRIYSMNSVKFMENEHKMLNRKQIEGRSRGSVSIGHLGLEAKTEVVFLGLESLNIGGFQLQDVHVITTQGRSHLGAPLLKYGSVTFNPFKKTMLFQPYDGKMSRLVSNPQIEKRVVPDMNGRPMIGIVWERSDAYKDGFRPGDVIIAIDGKPISTVSDYQNYPHLPNQTCTFTVRDERDVMKVITSKW